MLQITSFSENVPSLDINDAIRAVEGAKAYLVRFSWKKTLAGSEGFKHYYIVGAKVAFPANLGAIRTAIIQ